MSTTASQGSRVSDMTAAPPVDELLLPETTGGPLPRPHAAPFWQWLEAQPESTIQQARQDADLLFQRVGITFNVYGDEAGAERLIPFDLIPRILPWQEWQRLEDGLRQRVQALNAFLQDVYHAHRIVEAGIIPADLVFQNAQYRPEMTGIALPH